MARKKPIQGPKPRKLKQQHLPNMEPPRHPDLDDAANNYYDAMMERCSLSKVEDEMKTALIEKMREHGLNRYETPDGKVVMLADRANVKVKPKKEKADGEMP